MISLPTAIVVGATSRNCGKTTFICKLLEQFSAFSPFAVKIKTVYPGDSRWHGRGGFMKLPYSISEESISVGMDDSKRMLYSGAEKVFYVKSHISSLRIAIDDLINQIPPDSPIILESNSVMEHLLPAAFFMIAEDDQRKYKPSARHLIHKASLLIKTDGVNHYPAPSELKISWDTKQGFFFSSDDPAD